MKFFGPLCIILGQLLVLVTMEEDNNFEAEIETDFLNCPHNCGCQYAPFRELPIARWVKHNQLEDIEDNFYETNNIKLATCLFQSQNEANTLLMSLPMNLQALILLYTGVDQLTVNTSSLKMLNQLNTLEIRGADAMRLIIDEPLDFLQHANFEHLQLLGSDQLRRPKYSELPSDNYDYKPRSERRIIDDDDNDKKLRKDGVKYQLEFEAAADAELRELEILPYEQYVQLLKQTRMPVFYGWTRLQVLRVHSCQLQELHWQMFDGLAALQHLSLERNGIETLPPFALYGALHIKTLSLAHNALQRLHYLALAGLLELETLDLSDNRLERLSELSFPPLPQLQFADFRDNPLNYILPATFWVMNDTREMYFGSTEAALELWTNQPFDSLHKLRKLSMENVSINSLGQGVFKGLTALETLILRGDIHSIEFDAFAGLGQLRELDLSYCGIREISMDALMGCKQLEILKLSHNNLTTVPPGLFDEQPQLQDIHLQGNQLRTLPISFFRQPKLRVAHLNDNPWQCSCDMSNWMPRLTNVVRGPSVERCITDFLTGQPISCRRVESFEADKTLAPRCANFNGRSVYYALRKQLHCGGMRVLRNANSNKQHNSTRGLPHWRKMERQRKRKSHSNSLENAMHQQQQQQPERQQQSAINELSNEI